MLHLISKYIYLNTPEFNWPFDNNDASHSQGDRSAKTKPITPFGMRVNNGRYFGCAVRMESFSNVQ